MNPFASWSCSVGRAFLALVPALFVSGCSNPTTHSTSCRTVANCTLDSAPVCDAASLVCRACTMGVDDLACKNGRPSTPRCGHRSLQHRLTRGARRALGVRRLQPEFNPRPRGTGSIGERRSRRGDGRDRSADPGRQARHLNNGDAHERSGRHRPADDHFVTPAPPNDDHDSSRANHHRTHRCRRKPRVAPCLGAAGALRGLQAATGSPGGVRCGPGRTLRPRWRR